MPGRPGERERERERERELLDEKEGRNGTDSKTVAQARDGHSGRYAVSPLSRVRNTGRLAADRQQGTRQIAIARQKKR